MYHFLQGFWYRYLSGAKLREMEQAARSAGSDAERRAIIAHLSCQELAQSLVRKYDSIARITLR